MRDAVEAMRGLVQDEEAELEIGETTAAEVLADTDSMLQVLGNLIENGIKYGRARNAAQSRVVVSAREVSEPGDGVRVQRAGLWSGDCVGTPGTDLRAVLPGGQGAVAGVGGDGAGAVHRAAHGGVPGRDDPGGERAERGEQFSGDPAEASEPALTQIPLRRPPEWGASVGSK